MRDHPDTGVMLSLHHLSSTVLRPVVDDDDLPVPKLPPADE
jgi:hypothetical protein